MVENVLNPVIEQLKTFGFFEIVLPFLLTFAIFWGVLQTSGFGGKQTKAKGVIAFVAAAFVMISPMGPRLATFFANFFTNITIFIVGIMFAGIVVLMVWRMANRDDPDKDAEVPRWMFWIGALAVLFVFGYSGGFQLIVGDVELTLSTGDWAVIIIIGTILLVALALIGSYMTSEEKKQARKDAQKVWKKIITGDHH